MPSFIQYLGLGLSTAAALVAASPMPQPTPAAQLKDAVALEKRASCTFTDAAAVSKSKTSCATIVLNSIPVPSGTTLDLTKLTQGTHVRILDPLLFRHHTNIVLRLYSRVQLLLDMKNGLGL